MRSKSRTSTPCGESKSNRVRLRHRKPTLVLTTLSVFASLEGGVYFNHKQELALLVGGCWEVGWGMKPAWSGVGVVVELSYRQHQDFGSLKIK